MSDWRKLSVAVEASVGGYVTAMAKADKATGTFAQGLQRAGGGVEALEQRAAKLDKFAGGMTRNVTLPIVAAGGVAMKMAADFNTSFTQMQALAGVSSTEVDGLKQSVLGLSGETGRAPQELADGLYNVRSSGLEGAAAMEVLEMSAKGAAIGLGETKSLTDLLTSVMTAYAGTGLTAAQATDQLIAAISAGKAEPAEMAGVMGQLLPVAAELGIGFDELAGSVGYLSLTSGDTSKSATQLSGIMLKLLKPTKQGAKELAAVGLSADKLRSVVANEGLLPALQLLDDRLGGNSEAMGRVFDDSEGLVGVLGLLRDGGKPAAEVLDQVADSAGNLDESFGDLQKTEEFKFQQALADLQAAGISIGSDLIPIFANLAGGIASLASAFSTLPGPVQSGIIGFLGLAAAIGPIAKVTGGAMTGLAGLQKALSSKALDSYRLGLMGMTEAGAGAGNKLGGLVASMGGLPVVAGAAAAGAGLLAIALIDMAGESERAKANVQGLIDAAEGAGRSLEDAFNDKLINTLAGVKDGFNLDVSGKNFRAWVEDAGLSVTELSTALTGSTKEWDAFTKKLATDFGDNVEFSPLIEQLQKLREDGKDAIGTDQKLAATKRDLGVVTEETTASQIEQTEATAAQSEEFDTAAERIQAAEDALRGYFDATTSLMSTQFDVADSIDSMVESLEAGNKSFDGNTKAGRDNVRQLQDFRDRSLEASIATARASGNVEDGIAAMNGYKQSMIDQATAAGASRDQVTFLLESMGMTPEEIRTQFLINSNLTEVDAELDETAQRNRTAVIFAEALVGDAEFGLAGVTDKSRVAQIIAQALADDANLDLNSTAGKLRIAKIIAQAGNLGATEAQIAQLTRDRTVRIYAQRLGDWSTMGQNYGGGDAERPARASGGPVWPGLGLTWVGENGPELVEWPTSAYVHDAASSKAMAAGWKGMAARGALPSVGPTRSAPAPSMSPSQLLPMRAPGTAATQVTVKLGDVNFDLSGSTSDAALARILRDQVVPAIREQPDQVVKVLSRYEASR